MAKVFAGRYTAETSEPFVVFMIGMRVNRLLAVHKWLPTMLAMGPMLNTLYRHPEKGFLGARTFISWRQVMVVQHWRSFEDVERFARSQDDPHLPAWRRFNKAVGYKTPSVGIWHETYLVEAGHFEALYGNMPTVGLAAATKHVPVTSRRDSARQRVEAVASREHAVEAV